MYKRPMTLNRNYGGIAHPNYNRNVLHRGGTINGLPLTGRDEPLTITESKHKDIGGLRITKFYLPAAFDPSDPNTWDNNRPVIFT